MMGWAIGYDSMWQRDIGYGVPATCDHPDCDEVIDRGLAYVCGGQPYGGSDGCGLYFCGRHLVTGVLCERCYRDESPFMPKPDRPEWIAHKATDPSWAEWRKSQHVTEKSSPSIADVFTPLPDDEAHGLRDYGE